MKKKLLAILLILVLAITAIVATACTKNTERDFKQITAKVSYADRVSQVDKLDLNATIYSFVYQYYNYYSQGYITQANYQSVLDNIDKSYKQANESLAETEAYTLKCIEELYQFVLKNGTEEEKDKALAASTKGMTEYEMSARIREIESILPLKDMIAAVDAYNEEMQESFDSFLEAYESEIAKSETKHSTDNVKELVITNPWKLTYEKGESFNENGLKVEAKYEGSEEAVTLDRDEYTVTGFSSDEVKDAVEVTVTFGKTTASFEVKIVEAKVSRPAMPKDDEEEAEKTEVAKLFQVDLDEQIAAAKKDDPDRYKALLEAKRRLEKQMSSNYRTYEYYYLSKLKDQVVTAYEEIVGKSASGVTQAEILAEFEKRLNEQALDLRFGISAYGDKTEATSVKSQIVHEDGEVFYVQHVLLKLSSDLEKQYTAFENEKVANKDALWEYKKGLIDDTMILVSNPEYDKDAKCEEEECTCTACVNYKGENPGECTDENCTCKKCPNKRYLTSVTYGDDQTLTSENEEGTFGILDLLNAIYADLDVMTAESTVEARVANLDAFKRWIYMCNEDDGIFSTLSSGGLGYKLSMTDSSYVEAFTELSRLLAYGSEAAKADSDYHIVGSGIGSFGYCYTEYGIHVIILSGYALPEEYATEAYQIGNTEYYAIAADAVTDYTSYKPAEAGETNTPAKGTILYDIVESLEKEKKDAKIGEFKKDFYQNAMKNDVEITYYDKVYKDLIEQYQD